MSSYLFLHRLSTIKIILSFHFLNYSLADLWVFLCVNCHGVTGASRKLPPILGYTVDKGAFTQINIDTLICVLRKSRYSSTYKD